jgi:hypothetical protein
VKEALELAWAAGLFEGEGSIYAEPKNGRHYLRFCLSTTDKDVIDRFAAVMECGKVYGPYAGTNKQRYDWRTKNHGDAVRAATLLWPWLGERREKQLQSAMAAIRTQRNVEPRRTFSVDDARELQRAGLSLRAIGRVLGVSHVSILNGLRSSV